MRFVIKLLISVCVIAVCAQIGRKLPSMAGLIAVMPLTGVVVLVWLYVDNPGDFELMVDYTRGHCGGFCRAFCFLLLFICAFGSS